MSALSAVRALLLAEPAAAVASGGRVFAPELPPTEAAHMPRSCIVLSYAGSGAGHGARSYLGVETRRIDMRCYGGPVEQQGWIVAEALYDAASRALLSLRGGVYGGHRLYTAVAEVGPIQMRDGGGNVSGHTAPDTGWPLVYSSWLLTVARAAADVEVA